MDPGPGPDPDLTIVLLGNTGVGKSATGNSILGRVAFESKVSLRAVTTEIRQERGRVCGKQISVVDTPGILESGSVQKIRTWCQIQLSSSTSCLYLVVVRVGRFTEAEERAVKLSIKVIGDIGLQSSILLFTGGDDLNMSLQDYVLQSNRSSLRDVVKTFEDRYLLFNNKTEDEEQVQQLLQQEEKLRSCELPGPQDLTIVLLGNTGVGKSATGNSILGRVAFESRVSLRPVTTEIRQERGRVCGKQISVVDTPGILGPGSVQQIRTWFQDQLSSSTPCLYLVVVRVGRFSTTDQEAVEAAIEVLGPRRFETCYLLFTGGDALKDMSLQDFLSEGGDTSLSAVVRRFSDRYHLFNNEDRGQEQVKDLLLKSAAGVEDALKLVNRKITLVGLPGGGRSSAANTILDSDRFPSHCGFDSLSTETVCESAAVEGRWVTVRDTPGLTVGDPDRMIDELQRCISDRDPEHICVFVVRIGRMSREESVLLQALMERLQTRKAWFRALMLWSPRLPYFVPGHRTMVLFTHGDQLRGQTIKQLIESNEQVSELVSMCKGRYCVLDNTQRGNRQQVRELLDKVDQTVAAAAAEREDFLYAVEAAEHFHLHHLGFSNSLPRVCRRLDEVYTELEN